MAERYRDARRFLAALEQMAEGLRMAIVSMRNDAERYDHLTELVAESEMVFGVWPDPEAFAGMGIQIIKGEDIMPPLIGFETECEIRILAIPCVGRGVANAARDVWGAVAEADESAQECVARAKLLVAEAE